MRLIIIEWQLKPEFTPLVCVLLLVTVSDDSPTVTDRKGRLSR